MASVPAALPGPCPTFHPRQPRHLASHLGKQPAQPHCLCSLWLHVSPNDVKNLQRVLERVTEAKKEQLSAAPTPREKQEECCSVPAKVNWVLWSN